MTFSNKCNFPDENIEEDFDEDLKNKNFYTENLNRGINLMNNMLEENEKRREAKIKGNLADHKEGKLLNKKILTLNKVELNNHKNAALDFKKIVKKYE